MNSFITAVMALITAIMSLFYTPSELKSVNPSVVPEPSITQNVTIMTYNVYVAGSGERSPENRTPLVIENIRRYMPDSFGIEEADEGWVERIAEAMPEYAYVGKGRNFTGGGEASPVFYKKDKYELVDSGTFWLSRTPKRPSHGWDAMMNRVCSYAVLKDKETGFVYAHFNAHFDHIGKIARLESVSVVADMISKKCLGIPVVFSGDLNDDEGSDMYNRILECGMRDTKFIAETADNCGTYHGYSEATESVRTKPIDFIFVNAFASEVKSYTVDRTQLNGMYASDHHPVIVEMTLFN